MKQKNDKKEKKFRINYQAVVQNLPFFLFLSALAVVYIYNGHYYDKIIKSISRTNNELKELQFEYKTIKSDVMFRSKQTEVAKAVDPLGLMELTTPPVVIKKDAGQ
jgi:hypothetical protein